MSERPGESPDSFTQRSTEPPAPYWYDRNVPAGARDVLQAVRRFRQTDHDMRRRSERYMHLNASDMEALRLIVSRERHGQTTTPGDLTAHLGITSAATTKLLGRIESSGFVTRSRNPHDGRGQLLRSTPSAHQEVRRSLGDMHAHMIALAGTLTAEQQHTVIGFLDGLSNLFQNGPDENLDNTDEEQP